MITFIKELNKTQIAGIIIAIIASVYALINENENFDTISGVIAAIGISLLILGKSHLKTQI
jgi:protein involved in ribonucleotide reduction